MDPKMQAVFDPLAQALRTVDYTYASIFELIGSFCATGPIFAFALSSHAKDIFDETQQEDIRYTEIVVEMYRRTFFDAEAAAKYGSDVMLQQGEQFMKSFAESIISGIESDRIQDAAGSSWIPQPQQSH